MDTKYKQLIQQAIEIRSRAYAPYSQFQVGAALLTADGQTFCGCNVENGVLGLSLCAERVAMTRAITDGVRDFSAIAIAANPAATPCGSCRQFMIEFNPEITVIVVDADNCESVKVFQAAELLPDFFRLQK